MKVLLAIAALALPLVPAAVPTAQEEEGWTQEELERVTRRIQGEVESIRGAEFEREVAVRITDKKGFFDHATDRIDEMIGPEELAAEQDVARLLGLIPPDMDLLQVTLDALEEQVGGFYDPSKETFYLMKGFTGKIAEIILSHELTHALDDQLFDIDGTLEPLISERDASNAYQAVVEGSGTLVMQLWAVQNAAGLDAKDLEQATSMGTEALSAAPPYVWKPLFAAYLKGLAFLTYGQNLADGGPQSAAEAIDRAFGDPPSSTEQILHPEKYWNEKRRDEPREIVIEVGALPEGWKVLDESTLGELVLALLAEDLDGIDLSNPMAVYGVQYTNRAASGWGGDRMVLLGSEGARILHVATYWDSVRDAKQFAEMLDERKESWREHLAELDAEHHGLRIDSTLEEEAPRVVLSASFGASLETLERVLGAVEHREASEE